MLFNGHKQQDIFQYSFYTSNFNESKLYRVRNSIYQTAILNPNQSSKPPYISMAYRSTGSRSMRQGMAPQDHGHEVIDVKDLIRKGGGVPHPGVNDVLTLTRFLERTINVSSGALDTALGRKRSALEWLRDRSAFPDSYTFPHNYGRLQPHLLASSHYRATEVDLTWLFSIFNAIFFMSALPCNTRVFQENSSTFNLGHRVYLPERNLLVGASIRCAVVANVSANFVKRDDSQFLPPTINVPSSHLNHWDVEQLVPWEDQVGSLLGSMIDLFIQYYSCREDGCRSDKFTHGKMHRGEAWQIIAYRFETSSTMRSTERALGNPIKLRRKEDYEWELSHWSLRELNKLENLLVRRTIETWGWAPDSQLTYVKAAREKKENEVRARDHERTLIELDWFLDRHESRAMDEPILSHPEITGPRFEMRGSPSGVGGYRLEGIPEEREPRSRAAPSRSRGSEIRTETRESRYEGSEPPSGRMRSLFGGRRRRRE